MKTKRGSCYALLYSGDLEFKDGDVLFKGYNLSTRSLRDMGFPLTALVQSRGPCELIVSAPYLDVEILSLFERPERIGVEEVSRSPFEGLKPSREVLESIVVKALKDLGFSVRANVKLPSRGEDVEVDVWALKNVGSAQLRVYASCKNWDKDVDRQIVDHEFGRTLQLTQVPHLRVLVVKGLTEPARKAALDNGFFVIELGEKASIDNAQEIYELGKSIYVPLAS